MAWKVFHLLLLFGFLKHTSKRLTYETAIMRVKRFKGSEHYRKFERLTDKGKNFITVKAKNCEMVIKQ